MQLEVKNQSYFTADQQKAIATFNHFLNAPESRRCMILSGYAGTGKTTLVSHMVNELKTAKQKVRLLAPTGRAAKVMQTMSDFPASTIHKQIYFMADGFNERSFVRAKNLYKNTLFIVDEVSMIGVGDGYNELNVLADLLEYVYSGDSCSLLLVGDPGQLPPVGQEESPALRAEYLKTLVFDLRIFEHGMTTVVRQEADSDILINATEIRNSKNFQPPFFSTYGNQVFRVDGSEFQEITEAKCTASLGEFMLVTLSNKRALKWNLEIRSRVFQYEEILVRNELLMVVKNNYYWLKNSEYGFIANGEQFIIVRIIAFEECYGLRFARLLVSLESIPDKEWEVLCFIDALFAEQVSLPRDFMKNLFFEIEKDYVHIKNKRMRYKEILNNPYFNALQIKYAYALTVHKAQGGQWDYVAMDIGYLPPEMKDKNLVRWMYTAVTRAKKELYLVNFPSNYFT